MNKFIAAFRTLRKKGYTAKRHFWCCNSCAWCALTDEEAEKAVFLHAQAEDTLQDTGKAMLAWSGDGNEIVDVFTAHGLETDWNGEETRKIAVKVW